jgi:hypothetical protein
MLGAILLYAVMGVVGGLMFVVAVMEFARRDKQESLPKRLPVRPD